MTKVCFRKVYDGEIIAVFPYCWNKESLNLRCYAHIGQHGPCELDFYRNCTKPAKPDEYAELYEELKTIYGDLKVVKRLPRLSEVFN